MNSPFFPATFKLRISAWPEVLFTRGCHRRFRLLMPTWHSKNSLKLMPRLILDLSKVSVFMQWMGEDWKARKIFWPTWIPNGLSGYWHWPWNLPECWFTIGCHALGLAFNLVNDLRCSNSLIQDVALYVKPCNTTVLCSWASLGQAAWSYSGQALTLQITRTFVQFFLRDAEPSVDC